MKITTTYSSLVDQIGALLQEGRQKAAYEVNAALVETYWHIGEYIVNFEQKGNDKAAYGSQLSRKLTWSHYYEIPTLFADKETLQKELNKLLL